jgi:hypothetical protein
MLFRSEEQLRRMVPKGGLEPPRVAPYAPQTYVSTSSTTSAVSRARWSSEGCLLFIRLLISRLLVVGLSCVSRL